MGFDCYTADCPDPAGRDDPGYFRLSIHVGDAFMSAMHELGMLAGHGPDGHGIPAPKLQQQAGELIAPAELRTALATYDAVPEPVRYSVVRAHVQLLVADSGQLAPPGAPPELAPHMSAGLALEVQRIGAPATIGRLLDKWAAWIAYLQRAAEHGGLRVR